MTFTVLWVPRAELELAALWTNDADRGAITQAANEIDRRLQANPETEGEARTGAFESYWCPRNLSAMVTETRYEHVVLDPYGTPLIAGTTMKVRELIVERLAWGWSPEELLVNHPYLTLGQIFSALAYYADHQAEMDRAVEQDLECMDRLRQQASPSPLAQRLKLMSRRK